MEAVITSVRLDKDLFNRVKKEAERRKKKVSEVLRELIAYGFVALPPAPEPDTTELIADTWDKLGPAPEIDYNKL